MKKDKIISIGLDLSLTGTGVVVLENSKIIEKRLIKSKPTGDRPIDELRRIQNIVGEIRSTVLMRKPNVAVIENLAFSIRRTTSLTQLAGLSFLVRAMLNSECIPFFLCAPTTLKRFATGKGNSEKDHMILEAYKQYGIDNIDNNIADSLFLAKIGLALLGYKKLTAKYQIETIGLLKKQS